MSLIWTLAALAAVWALAYHRAPLWLWTTLAALAFGLVLRFCAVAAAIQIALWSIFGVLALLLNVPPLRRRLLTRPVFALFQRIMPAMSDTEREALEAGTVGGEAGRFNGAPRGEELEAVPKARVT